MKPGIHSLGADAYHADEVADTPTLSASIANVLLTHSPAHARAAHPKLNPQLERKTDDKFDIGTTCHSLLLEGINVAEVIQADSWRQKWAQEARDIARGHGRVPLLPGQYDQVIALVDAVAVQIEQLDVDPLPLTAGKPEQTMVWDENGVRCRARIDWLHDDLSACDDLKTSTRSANPEQWTRWTLYAHGADVQAALYLRGLKAITGKDVAWRWLVVETSPPYALSVIAPGPDVLALANAKVDRALELWRRCLETDVWPGYPRETCWATLPAWMEAAWMEREAREEIAA